MPLHSSRPSLGDCHLSPQMCSSLHYSPIVVSQKMCFLNTTKDNCLKVTRTWKTCSTPGFQFWTKSIEKCICVFPYQISHFYTLYFYISTYIRMNEFFWYLQTYTSPLSTIYSMQCPVKMQKLVLKWTLVEHTSANPCQTAIFLAIHFHGSFFLYSAWYTVSPVAL